MLLSIFSPRMQQKILSPNGPPKGILVTALLAIVCCLHKAMHAVDIQKTFVDASWYLELREVHGFSGTLKPLCHLWENWRVMCVYIWGRERVRKCMREWESVWKRESEKEGEVGGRERREKEKERERCLSFNIVEDSLSFVFLLIWKHYLLSALLGLLG